MRFGVQRDYQDRYDGGPLRIHNLMGFVLTVKANVYDRHGHGHDVGTASTIKYFPNLIQLYSWPGC